MSTSQNGYKANDSSLIATYTIARDVKVSLRKGDVSVVLLHFAKWFDQNIEPLTKKDTGGYNPRFIEGTKTLSNHASGTAEDLRWNKHPRGKKNTFTAGQQDKIRKQLKFYEGVIRWGGDYKNIVDDMHFEINKGLAEVARIAKKCKAGSTPKPTNPTPKPPSLPHVPVDGDLGPKTISLWQKIMKTPVDGKISDKKSELVEAVQRRLKATVDHRLSVDGDLGPKTIRRLQSYLKAPVDGILGPNTVKALQRRLNTGKF
jgi:peptidoglycan hydrolase-like protein with peptidoglycan-binding domain